MVPSSAEEIASKSFSYTVANSQSGKGVCQTKPNQTKQFRAAKEHSVS